jgi:hypothetical protein
LGFDSEALAALARSGSVHFELRGRRRIAKLRFRISGKQVSKYLGSDLDFISQVNAELTTLQSSRRSELALHHVVAQARAAMRLSKKRLAPQLAATGLVFHGFYIRRPRHHVDGGRSLGSCTEVWR